MGSQFPKWTQLRDEMPPAEAEVLVIIAGWAGGLLDGVSLAHPILRFGWWTGNPASPTWHVSGHGMYARDTNIMITHWMFVPDMPNDSNTRKAGQP